MRTLLCSLVVLAAGSGELPAADLSLGTAIAADRRAALELVLTGAGEDLAGLQCDVEFDGENLAVAFSSGPSTTEAGKNLLAKETAAGRWRLLVAGLNRTSLIDGTVVLLNVEIKAPAGQTASHAIRILNATGSTLDGKRVPMKASDGSVADRQSE